MVKVKNIHKTSAGKPKGKNELKELNVDGRIRD
jgi:hypothetical protein